MAQELFPNEPIRPPFILNVKKVHLTEEQFEELCQDNPDVRVELTAKGELVIMPPTGYDSGWRNSELNYQVSSWSRRDKTGIVFDSQTMFTFPNGAKRMPDVSWIRKEKTLHLTAEDKKGFARVTPDFVIELRSPSDDLEDLKDKMIEYIENGVRLGWLIDPLEKRVHIYRPEREPEILDDPETISGEDVLAGFTLNVREVW